MTYRRKPPKKGMRRATPQDALTAYLAMDRRERSIPKTQKALQRNPVLVVPSLNTLKKWHKEDSWPDVAVDHDYKMSTAISEKLIEVQSADYAEMAKNLYQVGGLALNRIAALLSNVKLRGFDEIDVDARIAMMMIHAAAVLEGRIDTGRGGGLGEPAEIIPDGEMESTVHRMDDALRAFKQITSEHSVQHQGNGKGNGHG